jgi:iron complex outermembrane recepter protein
MMKTDVSKSIFVSSLVFKRLALVSAIAGIGAVESVPVLGAEFTIEEVVVTARQREESLQNVPLAIDVISAETLENLGITDTRDLQNYSPGLIINRSTNGGGARIDLRGIGTSGNEAGFEQTVSVAVDGVQVGRPRVIFLGLMDMQQIAIMKGPQALFFGKNSPAGVIALKSADPTEEFEGYIRTNYEFKAEEVKVTGAVSGPLTDRIGARLAFSYRDMAGWINNDFNRPLTDAEFPFDNGVTGFDPGPTTPGHSTLGQEEDIAARLTLTYASEDGNFTANLKLNTNKYEDSGPANGSGYQTIFSNGFPGTVSLGVHDPFEDGRLNAHGTNARLPDAVVENYPLARPLSYGDMQQDLVSLTMDWQIGDWTLTSVSGYYDLDSTYFDAYDASSFAQITAGESAQFEALSQEFRLASNFDGKFNYLVGAYYQDVEQEFGNSVRFGAHGPDFRTAATEPKYHTWEKLGTTDGKTVSFFGQLLIDITEQIELSSGLRWTQEKKDSSLGHLFFNQNVAPFFFPLPEGRFLENEFKEENVSPEISLTYKPTDDLTLYAAYRTGFKSGGFAIGSTLLGYVPGVTNDEVYTDGFRFDSEEVDGYELGFKAVFMDGHLNLNGTFYTYGYDDLQVTTFDNATVSFQLSNAAKATQEGAELDVIYRPRDLGLTLYASLAYNITEYKDYIADCYTSQTFAQGCNVLLSSGADPVDPAGDVFGRDLAGFNLPNAPEITMIMGFDYETPIFDSMAIGFSANARYSDKYNYTSELDPRGGIVDSFWLVDASVRLLVNDNLRVSLIGRNLTDELYPAFAADLPGGMDQLAGPPNRRAQYAIEVEYSF